MPRRLTGFTPSGNLHLGNYVGAMRPIIAEQARTDTVVFISDLHALTLEHDPADVRRRKLEFATLLLAAGADPDGCLILVQSHVPEHTELHYLLECTTGVRRGAAHDPVQGEVPPPAASPGVTADLPDPDGRRHPALRHRPAAGMIATHEMSVYKRYFDLIATGRKTTEIRVNDSTRRKITEGSLIRFHCRQEEVLTRVTWVASYASFEEMFDHESVASVNPTANP